MTRTPKQFYMNDDYGTRAHAAGELKYPFDKMEAGDFIEPPILFCQAAESCARKHGRKTGKKFKREQIGGKYSGLCRITRIN